MPFTDVPGTLIRAWLVLLMFTGCASAVAAGSPFHKLRVMAENDIVGAYAEVKRLRSTLSGSATETERVQLLNLQARIEFFLGLSEQAETHSNQAMDLATRADDRAGQAEAYLNLTRIALNQGKIEQSIEFTFRSYNLLEENTRHPELLGEVMFWLTLAYRRLGRVQESVNTALRAKEIAQENQNLFALAYAYRGLGLSYEQSNRTAEAFEYSRKMIEYAREIPSELIAAYGLQGMAVRADDSDDPDVPERYMRQAIGVYRKLESPFSLNIGLLSLARILSKQDRHAERVELLDEVVGTYQKHPNPLGLWYALTARSEGYQQLSRLEEAERDANAALQLALGLSDLSFHSQSLDRLAAIAAANKDYAAAYQLQAESAGIASRARERRDRSYIIDLVEQYEEESHRRQIEELNLHNAQQAEKLRQKKLQQRWLFTISISSLLLLLGTLFFLVRLRSKNALLHGLAARLESIREEERRRIARDMHDTMGQYLTALRMDLSGLVMLCQGRGQKIVERAHALKALVDKTIHIMRNIAASLRPAPLDMGGVSALEWLAEEFTKRSGVVCHLDVGNVNISLDDKYMTAIFRIVQESLTNVARHANASRVDIQMTTKGRYLALTVRDDGKGFRADDKKGTSYGLAGMRERAMMLGGDLRIRSVLNAGTTVSFHVRVPEGEGRHD